ncbi:phosphotransferase family protein [Kribbella sp. CA-293567]|uniref:phosphotransferase family protein n=1 Tax=Kribbella sp. CA-293567 TaxID=3002436 RepID=UPI0022DDF3ED|nr:aminoglycoside phosphotransferase family protein [Kribbella sp. CA-293567]WBQ04644.1 aminoglycoside phosphotransferase family protein [Kribbella sp. CA-293567]
MQFLLRDTLATRYGVPAEAIREVPGGVANRAYTLGDDLFVRIPRRAAFEADLVKEATVIPLARAAGVRTPPIVDFDTTRGLVDAPYMVLERVHGTDLVEGATPPSGFWQELGRQLTLLHKVAQQPTGVPADDGGGDPRPTVDGLATKGYLDLGTARWLLGVFDHLATYVDPGRPPVLLHGDVGQQNLMLRDNQLQAIIDWGDAAWGPPGMEFAKLTLEQVAATLSGYSGREGLEASALWFHLSWGLSGLTKGPQPGQRHWTAPPGSRLLGVLRFYASSPPEPWPELLSQKTGY